MDDGVRQPFRRRVLLCALALPLLAAPAIAYAVSSDEGTHVFRPPLAQGSIGGPFHPVAGGFEPDATVLEGCRADPACLEQAFGNIAFRKGPRAALARFEAQVATDSDVEADCHRIVHTIGSAALERYDGNVARTFSEGSPTCISGYYHGILERSFRGVSTKAGLADVARLLCVGAGVRRRGFLDYQCRHGLGHGLMIQTGYDLPLALSVCAGLGTKWDRLACSGGAFMENLGTRFGVRSPWLDDDDPLYPCTRVRARDRQSCYLRATRRMLAFNEDDFAKTAHACARLGRWSRTCFQGLGRDTVEASRSVPGKILALCDRAGAGRGDCLRGAARTLANNSGPKGIAPASALCRRAPFSERDACFSGVGLVLGLLEPTDAARKAACVEVTRSHLRACFTAALAEVEPNGKAWG